jgi:hypothetical protein
MIYGTRNRRDNRIFIRINGHNLFTFLILEYLYLFPINQKSCSACPESVSGLNKILLRIL